MSTISKERAELKAFITGFLSDPAHDDKTLNSLTAEVFRIALASLEAEAVAEVCEGFTLRYIGHGPAPKYGVKIGDRLYAAQPAPVSVPDEDLLHMAASAIEDLLSNKDRYCSWVWADIPAKLRRAAFLRGLELSVPDYDQVLESLDSDVRINILENEHVSQASRATYDGMRAAMLHGGKS